MTEKFVKFIENNQIIKKLKIGIPYDPRIYDFELIKQKYMILDALEKNTTLIEIDIKMINIEIEKLNIIQRNQLILDKKNFNGKNISKINLFDCKFNW